MDLSLEQAKSVPQSRVPILYSPDLLISIKDAFAEAMRLAQESGKAVDVAGYFYIFPESDLHHCWRQLSAATGEHFPQELEAGPHLVYERRLFERLSHIVEETSIMALLDNPPLILGGTSRRVARMVFGSFASAYACGPDALMAWFEDLASLSGSDYTGNFNPRALAQTIRGAGFGAASAQGADGTPGDMLMTVAALWLAALESDDPRRAIKLPLMHAYAQAYFARRGRADRFSALTLDFEEDPDGETSVAAA